MFETEINIAQSTEVKLIFHSVLCYEAYKTQYLKKVDKDMYASLHARIYAVPLLLYKYQK